VTPALPTSERPGSHDPEAAAEVEQRVVADLAQHLGELLVHLELEDLRADVGVQPAQLEPRRGDSLDRARDVGEAEPELRVLLAGLDVRVRARLDPRGHAQHHALTAAGGEALQAIDLVE
jgi:hypothetical protein